MKTLNACVNTREEQTHNVKTTNKHVNKHDEQTHNMKTLNRCGNTREKQTRTPTINYTSIPLKIAQTYSAKTSYFLLQIFVFAMDKKTGKGRQKIEIKLIESEAPLVYYLKKGKKVCSRKQMSFQLGQEQVLMLCFFHQVENHIPMASRVKI